MGLKGLSQAYMLRAALLASAVLFVLQCPTQAQVLPEDIPSKPPLSPTAAQDLVKVVEDIAGLACNKSPYFLCPSPPPPPAPGTPVPPAPPAASPGPLELEDGDGYYRLPLTRFTLPGQQTRTQLNAMFPSLFFVQPLPSDEPTSFITSNATTDLLTSYLAGSPVPAGSNGGWTTYSTDSGVVVIHWTPLSNGQVLLMERPGNREAPPQIAAVYNLNTNTYRYFPMTDSPFCSGHIQLITDQVLVVGGDNIGNTDAFVDGRFNVRVFNGGASPNYSIVDVMPPFPGSTDPNSGARWYPSLLTMVDGNVLIVGGETTEGGGYANVGLSFVNPTYQFFQLNNQSITQEHYLALLDETNPVNLYPFTTIMPNTGRIMIQSGNRTRFYAYTPGLLTNDTTTYSPVPDLVRPVSYPQTASIVLLPLELPNYNPRILVVGGTAMDMSLPGDPADNSTQLLDFSRPPPYVWQVEPMSTPRVMPDTVLLPDGTLFICNGGNVGIAGGSPGSGQAANTNPLNQAPEIYNISAPFGSRMSGLLATSGRDRLYHSVAYLTTNAEVLVTGSEATEDYTMQIYTPQYLLGTFSRPVLGTPSTNVPAYGATFTIPLSYVGGAAVPITRAVFNRQGGVTHSTHFDQRQIALVYTVAGSTMTITVPPNTTIAPPGIYMLFVVTSQGRPSQAVYFGLGGAVPQATFIDAPRTQTFANGTYTITSLGRAACNASLSARPCNLGKNITMGPASTTANPENVWQLNYLPHAPNANTYQVVNFARLGSCFPFLGAQECVNGNNVFAYNEDDISGKQQWTITPAANGGYNIQVLVGREPCAAPYLSTVACGSAPPNFVSMTATNAGAGLQSWNLTAVPTPNPTPQSAFVPYFANGTYIITNNGRPASCGNYLGTDTCTDGNDVEMITTSTQWNLTQLPNAERDNTYTLTAIQRGCTYNLLSGSSCPASFINLFDTDDGTGRQEFTLTQTATGYNMEVFNGRFGCGPYVGAQTCNADSALVFYSIDDGSGLQDWTITPFGTPPPSGPVIPNGAYQIANTGRTTCGNVLDGQTCAAGVGVTMGEPGTTWLLTYLPNATYPNTYNVNNVQRTGGCPRTLLSCASCPTNLVDMFNIDDGSGRQEWTFTPVTGGYTISVLNGRVGCEDSLTAEDCATGAAVDFVADVSSALQVWTVGAPAPPSGGPYFANGNYQIINSARGACAAALSAQDCSAGVGVLMAGGGTWTLTWLPNAAQPNTYTVTATGRVNEGLANCTRNLLSCAACPVNNVDLFDHDDGSGRQEWTFVAAGTGYYIEITQGRGGCNDYLSSVACGTAGSGVEFAAGDDGSGLQIWDVVAPAPPAPPSQILANGNYYIQNSGRTACNNTLSTQSCASGTVGPVMSESGDPTAEEVWTLAYVPTAASANSYTITSTARATCNNILSCGSCPANFIDLFDTDDGSGRQEWEITPVTSGDSVPGYTISIPVGRNGCEDFMQVGACGVDNTINFAANQTSALQVWTITSTNPAAGK